MLRKLNTPGDIFLGDDFFKQHYSAEEQSFLQEFLPAHPDIAAKFDKYVNIAASERLAFAKQDLEDEVRASWNQIQTREPRQSVAGHVDGMLKVADELRDLFTKDNLQDVVKQIYKPHEATKEVAWHFQVPELFEQLKSMIELHDIAEAIVGDIPNHEVDQAGEIGRKDKIKIEMCAAKLLFQEEPANVVLFDEYEKRDSLMARLAKAIDILEFMKRSVYEESQLNAESSVDGRKREDIFDEYWRTATKRLDRAFQGIEMPHVIKAYRDQIIAQHDMKRNLYL